MTKNKILYEELPPHYKVTKYIFLFASSLLLFGLFLEDQISEILVWVAFFIMFTTMGTMGLLGMIHKKLFLRNVIYTGKKAILNGFFVMIFGYSFAILFVAQLFISIYQSK